MEKGLMKERLREKGLMSEELKENLVEEKWNS
jgi:hypothetical protein